MQDMSAENEKLNVNLTVISQMKCTRPPRQMKSHQPGAMNLPRHPE
jgi:hypothetical protein